MWLKRCCIPRIFRKHTKNVIFCCLDDRRKSRHFFKLGAWRTVKNRACLLRFSALNLTAGSTPTTASYCINLFSAPIVLKTFLSFCQRSISKRKYEKLAAIFRVPQTEAKRSHSVRCRCAGAGKEMYKDL